MNPHNSIEEKPSPMTVEEAQEYENNLAMTWLGDIKKTFQTEQKRLEHEGVYLRLKPIWQTINECIILAQKRREKITGNPRAFIRSRSHTGT